MSEKLSKLEAVISDLDNVIESSRKNGDIALQMMSRMKLLPTEYRGATNTLSHATFVEGFLVRIRETGKGSEKDMERVMRFHAYQLHEKGNINGNDEIAAAERNVVNILDNLIKFHFEN